MAAPLNYAPGAERRGAPWWLWTLATLSLLGGAFWFFVPYRFTSTSEAARVNAARADVAALDVALAAFREDTGRFPTAGEGLGALIIAPAGLDAWRGPYIKSAITPRDPWGGYYAYAPTRSSPSRVVSAGPDGATGTADDVTSR